MNGEQGENILLNSLYACFPEESPPQGTLKQCSASVQALIASPLTSFVSDSCRGATKTVAGIIASVAAGEKPSFKKGNVAGPAQTGLNRMLHFCSFTAEGRETVHGDTALKATFEQLQYLLNKKDQALITYEVVHNLQLYWWACQFEWADDIREADEILQAKGKGGGDGKGAGEPAAKKAKSFKNAEESASGAGAASSSSGPSKAELLRSKVLAQF